MSRGLCADLYELKMAASYRRHHVDDLATFSLFVRTLAAQRGYLVAPEPAVSDALGALAAEARRRARTAR